MKKNPIDHTLLWRKAMDALAFEALVSEIGAAEIASGLPVSEENFARYTAALYRLDSAQLILTDAARVRAQGARHVVAH